MNQDHVDDIVLRHYVQEETQDIHCALVNYMYEHGTTPTRTWFIEHIYIPHGHAKRFADEYREKYLSTPEKRKAYHDAFNPSSQSHRGMK